MSLSAITVSIKKIFDIQVSIEDEINEDIDKAKIKK